MSKTNNDLQTFGSWLPAQLERTGQIGDLIMGAEADRKFPRHGTVEDVRKRLSAMQANGNLFDDVETDWLAR